jgi:hypothetical protein
MLIDKLKFKPMSLGTRSRDKLLYVEIKSFPTRGGFDFLLIDILPSTNLTIFCFIVAYVPPEFDFFR